MYTKIVLVHPFIEILNPLLVKVSVETVDLSVSGSRGQCKGSSNGSYLYGGAPFGSGVSGGIYSGGSGASYGSYPPQSYNQEYQYSTSFQSSAASTSAYYGHSAASASSYYYNPSPSTSSTTPTAYASSTNPQIPGNAAKFSEREREMRLKII